MFNYPLPQSIITEKHLNAQNRRLKWTDQRSTESHAPYSQSQLGLRPANRARQCVSRPWPSTVAAAPSFRTTTFWHCPKNWVTGPMKPQSMCVSDSISLLSALPPQSYRYAYQKSDVCDVCFWCVRISVQWKHWASAAVGTKMIGLWAIEHIHTQIMYQVLHPALLHFFLYHSVGCRPIVFLLLL